MVGCCCCSLHNNFSLQTGSPCGFFWDLLSNGAWSKARGLARNRESLQWPLYELSSAFSRLTDLSSYQIEMNQSQWNRKWPCRSRRLSKNETFDMRVFENISTKRWKKTTRFIEVLPVNRLYFPFPLLKLCHALKRWSPAHFIYYYITAEIHYSKCDSAYECYVHVWVKTLIDILAHVSRNFDIFVLKITDLNVNTSIFWKGRVMFRVMKLRRCVIVDDSGSYVMFHKLNVRIMKK